MDVAERFNEYWVNANVQCYNTEKLIFMTVQLVEVIQVMAVVGYAGLCDTSNLVFSEVVLLYLWWVVMLILVSHWFVFVHFHILFFFLVVSVLSIVAYVTR